MQCGALLTRRRYLVFELPKRKIPELSITVELPVVCWGAVPELGSADELQGLSQRLLLSRAVRDCHGMPCGIIRGGIGVYLHELRSGILLAEQRHDLVLRVSRRAVPRLNWAVELHPVS